MVSQFGTVERRRGEEIMTSDRKATMKVGSKMGAVIGGLLFLLFGIVPAFYFGSFGTLLVLSSVAGGAVDPNILVRMLIVIGTVLGILCAGTISIMAGAATGAALGYLVDIASLAIRPAEKRVKTKG